jgi:hypothetical protein
MVLGRVIRVQRGEYPNHGVVQVLPFDGLSRVRKIRVASHIESVGLE